MGDRLGGELADLEQVKAQCLDLSQDAVKGRRVERDGKNGVLVMLPGWKARKGGDQGGAKMSVDPDQVPGRCRVHGAMLRRRQVSPHRQDLMTATRRRN